MNKMVCYIARTTGSIRVPNVTLPVNGETIAYASGTGQPYLLGLDHMQLGSTAIHLEPNHMEAQFNLFQLQ
jgi:hypothetical protein